MDTTNAGMNGMIFKKSKKENIGHIMGLKRPLNIAICLNAPTVKRALEQKEMLISLESDFNIEWDIRAERIEGNMLSYSQMINEAVLGTESEFMIFINPSTIPTPKDIYTMIDDLCSGFAFSSIVAFGFFALTKEVFRRIGMMDERFIGGEYEDTDFLLRLKQNNLAVMHRYRTDQYRHWAFNTDAKPTVLDQFRGITHTIFPIKWAKKENTFFKTDVYKKEKKAPTWLYKNKRDDIFNSWNSWEKTEYDSLNEFITFSTVYNSEISDKIAVSKKTRLNGLLKLFSKRIDDSTTTPLDTNCPIVESYSEQKKGNLLLIVFDANIQTELTVTVVDKNQQLLEHKKVHSNTWHLQDFTTDICDIRVYHNGRIILHHNNFSLLGADESYTLGLDVYEFDI